MTAMDPSLFNAGAKDSEILDAYQDFGDHHNSAKAMQLGLVRGLSEKPLFVARCGTLQLGWWADFGVRSTPF